MQAIGILFYDLKDTKFLLRFRASKDALVRSMKSIQGWTSSCWLAGDLHRKGPNVVLGMA